MSFETGANADPETAPWYADAAAATSDVLARMASQPSGRSALAGLTDVMVTHGVTPSARLSNGKLIITIDPSRGAAGRPPADEIDRAVRFAPSKRLAMG